MDVEQELIWSGREHRHRDHKRHTHTDSRDDSMALSVRTPTIHQSKGHGVRRDHSQEIGRLSGTKMFGIHLRKNNQKGEENKVKDQPDHQQDDHCPGTMGFRGSIRVEHAGVNSATEGKADNFQIPRSNNHIRRSFQPPLFRILTVTTDFGGDPERQESF